MTLALRPADVNDCRAIAELAMLAGGGIPAFFWESARQPGQDIIDAGRDILAAGEGSFSYRNTRIAELDDAVAGMLLAYRLPDADAAENLDELPGFVKPLVELEQCVPGSYYINMLATYPQFRNRAVGTGLMDSVDALATQAGCTLTSVEVFEQNTGALRLYQRLGYRIIERRAVIPHACHHYTGHIALLTRAVG